MWISETVQRCFVQKNLKHLRFYPLNVSLKNDDNLTTIHSILFCHIGTGIVTRNTLKS